MGVVDRDVMNRRMNELMTEMLKLWGVQPAQMDEAIRAFSVHVALWNKMAIKRVEHQVILTGCGNKITVEYRDEDGNTVHHSGEVSMFG